MIITNRMVLTKRERTSEDALFELADEMAKQTGAAPELQMHVINAMMPALRVLTANLADAREAGLSEDKIEAILAGMEAGWRETMPADALAKIMALIREAARKPHAGSAAIN